MDLCRRVCFVILCDMFCRAVFFLELLCDDDISLLIDVLDDFKTVDDVELLTENHLMKLLPKQIIA